MQRSTALLLISLTLACGDDSATPGVVESTGAVDGTTDGGDAGPMPGTDGGTTSGADDDGGSGPGVVLDVAPGDDGPGPSGCPCADGNDEVFLIDGTFRLWTFDPSSLAFEDRGALGCPAPGADVFVRSVGAFAADRGGRLTLVFEDLAGGPGAFETRRSSWSVAIDDPGDCQEKELGLPDDVVAMSATYASNGDATSCDDMYLFLQSGPAGRLGRIDEDVGTFSEIGPLDFVDGALSGTGDGRLFSITGFVDETAPGLMVEYDTHDAHEISSTSLPELGLVDGFRMAFWGGSLYVFTDADGDVSRIGRYDLDTLATTVVVEQTPMWILGATTSTCAPYTPAG